MSIQTKRTVNDVIFKGTDSSRHITFNATLSAGLRLIKVSLSCTRVGDTPVFLNSDQ